MNQGHPCSILKPVALSPTRFLLCTEFKGGDGKEEGERGIPGSLERAFDSILLWGCRFGFHLQACLLYCCKGGAGTLGQAPTYSSPQAEGAVFALPVH